MSDDNAAQTFPFHPPAVESPRPGPVPGPVPSVVADNGAPAVAPLAPRPRGRPRKVNPEPPERVIPPGVPPNHVARDGTIYYPPPGHPGLPPNQRYISPAEFASMSVKDLMRYAAAPPTPEEQAAIAAHYKDYKPPPPHDPLARLGELGAEARALPIIPAELPPLSPEALAAFEARHEAFMRGERPDWNALDAEDRANADREAERVAAEEAAEAEAASAGKGPGAGKGRRGTARKSAGVAAAPAPAPAAPAAPARSPLGLPPVGGDDVRQARVPVEAGRRESFIAWLQGDHGLSAASAYVIVSGATRVWRAAVSDPRAELGQGAVDDARLFQWWLELSADGSPISRQVRYAWRWWHDYARAQGLTATGPADLPTALDMDALGTLPARFYSAVGVLAGHCPGWADPLTWQTAYWTTELGDVLAQRRAALPTFAASPEAFAALAPADRLLLYLAAVIDDLASYSAPSGWRVGQRLIPRLPYSDRCADEAVLRRVIQMSLMSPAELSGVLTAPAKRKRGRPSRWSASGGAA